MAASRQPVRHHPRCECYRCEAEREALDARWASVALAVGFGFLTAMLVWLARTWG